VTPREPENGDAPDLAPDLDLAPTGDEHEALGDAAEARARRRLEEGGVLRDALDGLREELRSRLPSNEQGVDWMALYESLRRRFGSTGMRSLPAEVDEFGLDRAALAAARPWLDVLFDRWWRVEVSGADDLPRGRPCLFVANHSGLLPWDGLMVCHALARASLAPETPRFLVEDWLLRLPFAQAWLASLGGVRACRETAERLLRAKRSVVAFPEGANGATKVFRQRYRVPRFGRGGVVRTAIAARVPLVPVAVVGAEETHPLLFKLEAAARSIGLPFVPVTPTFPWLGPLGFLPLPSKWWIGFGEPLRTDELEPDAADDEILIWRMNEQLRAAVQTRLDEGLHERSSVWS
jgi:1-acyl-sn-glycerol-3-phosphate acyltransferase